MHGRKLLAVVVALVAFGIAIAPASSAAGRSAQRRRAIRSVAIGGTHIDDDGFMNWQLQSCNMRGVCKLKASGIVNYTGPMHGISQHETWFSYDPNTNLYRNDTYEWYTVTIDGCGTGRFLTHESGEYTPQEIIALQDPTTGQLQGGQGTWRLVPGTQSGDFTKMSSFYFQVDHVAFDFPTMENHETISRGTAVCS